MAERLNEPLDGPRKSRYMDWLLTPRSEREPSSETALADELGVQRRTLFLWRQQKEFVEEWERRYLARIGNPGRKQTIMDTLFKTATDELDPKHVQAAKAYFEIEGSLRPTKTEVNIQTGDASKLTIEQIEDLLATKAKDELTRRREAKGA